MTTETGEISRPGWLAGLRQGWQEWLQTDGPLWVFIAKALGSAFLGLWLAYRLELPQPTTVLATVFIVLQRQSGEVLAKSFYRIIGTLIGLTVMVTLIALFNQERVLFLLFLALWIGLCTAGAARYRDFRSYACILAGYTAVMIGLPAVDHPDTAFMQALWRVLEIVVGILCTGVVSGLILPQTSSGALRASQFARLRDFAAFAVSGLRGELEAEQVTRLNVRFAAEAVSLENMLTASAFEDPRLRVRRGRLGRLNNEFMVCSTRFHALHQLLLRLQGTEQGTAVLEALRPCLLDVAALLEPLGSRVIVDQEAGALAESVARSRSALMDEIRQGRAGLQIRFADSPALLDFNTAAELLFRFLADLESYFQTQASLVSHFHAREDFRDGFRTRANGAAAVMAGARSAGLVLLTSAFWLATAWPSGEMFVLTVGLVSGLISMSLNPGRLAWQLLGGAVASGLIGFVMQFHVYPLIDGFALLCAVLAPIFAFGAFLLARPAVMGYGIGGLIWFCILSLPANLTHYLPYQFFNNWLAMLLSMFVVAVTASLLFPPGQPWVWRRLEHDLRMQMLHAASGKLRALTATFESGTRDLLTQSYGMAARRPDVQAYLVRWMFVVIEIGHAIIELRREQVALPDEPWYHPESEWRVALRLVGRALARLFLKPDAVNHARALEVVEQAISVVQAAPEPCPPQFDTSPLRRVLSYLHFIRTSLLDPNSPLVESPPSGMERS